MGRSINQPDTYVLTSASYTSGTYADGTRIVLDNGVQYVVSSAIGYAGIWSTSGRLAAVRDYTSGAGTQSAGLTAGGQTSGTTATGEEYNGSAWSSGGSLTVAKYGGGLCGTQSAALHVAGNTGSHTGVTESYNGTSWSDTTHNLSTARTYPGTWGTTSDAVATGGTNGTLLSSVEEYNGSSWSSGTSIVHSRSELLNAAVGTGASSGMVVGGLGTTAYRSVFKYNGTTWTNEATLPVASTQIAVFGSPSAAVANIYYQSAANTDDETRCLYYDGTAWIANSPNITGGYAGIAAGSTTAGFKAGGGHEPQNTVPGSQTENYDSTDLVRVV